MKFKDKVVIITGSSSGIGLACAEEFASQGANLVLGARSYVSLCELARDLELKYKIRAIAVECDVTQEESCKLLIEQAAGTFNRIDVLVNNAGISMRSLFIDADLNVLKRLMDVNFWGTVYCTKYALPYLLKGQGSLVGVSSIAGYQGLPGRSGYSASKFAMQGFLSVIRLENMRNKLQVLIACPGFTASNIRKVALDRSGKEQGESPMEEASMMSAQEVAREIVHAIATRKRSLVLTREGKLTVFLSKFFPAFLDKMVFKRFNAERNSLLEVKPKA